AARGLFEQNGLESEDIARRAMKIAADICIYTNENVVVESL
ncbi:MAG TPA: HslU--HslV peptidase proteolytic subunit, partial [Rhodospirillaceae bacterium]|nr:HslU--HslV peptidase proteolytic subunit [Rhodospirillaceae bacterium]